MTWEELKALYRAKEDAWAAVLAQLRCAVGLQAGSAERREAMREHARLLSLAHDAQLAYNPVERAHKEFPHAQP